MMRVGRCLDCRFCKPVDLVGRDDIPSESYGICRLFPPDRNKRHTRGGHPVMTARDGCGHYRSDWLIHLLRKVGLSL